MFVKNTYIVLMQKRGPLIDLRKIKRSCAKINENQNDGKFQIINGNLNVLE